MMGSGVLCDAAERIVVSGNPSGSLTIRFMVEMRRPRRSVAIVFSEASLA